MTSVLSAAVGTWHPAPPTRQGDLLVVVAPHPDDEVLGAAATMRWWVRDGGELLVVGCTGGEASHAASASITAEELRRRRAAERAEALARLDLRAEVVTLGLADGGLGRVRGPLTDALTDVVPPGATVLVPWHRDDHPDHEAVGAAGATAADRRGARLWQTPIWGKVRGAPPTGAGAHRLRLTAAERATKAHAVAAFTSQVTALGPRAEDGPVLHPGELRAMLDGTELVLT